MTMRCKFLQIAVLASAIITLGHAQGTGQGFPGTYKDISTPSSNPASGRTKGYTKGGKVCALDSAGVETCTGSSGSGAALTIAGTSRQITVTGAGCAANTNGTCTVSIPANLLLSGQAANGDDVLSGSRITDTSPTGNFLMFKSLAGVPLWQVDIAGVLEAGSVPYARVIGAPVNPALLGGTQTFTAPQTFSDAVLLSGDLTPTALSGDVNDYNPATCADAFTLRIDGGASDRNITGVNCTPVAGRLLRVVNSGSTNNLTLVNQSASSSAANRFLLPADTVLPINTALVFEYDGTSSRWRPWSRALSNTGVAPGTYTKVAVDVAGRVTTGATAQFSDLGGAASSGQLPATAVQTNQANTYSGGGLQNMSAMDLLLPIHSSDPGTCTAGQIEFNSTGPSFKGCATTNTWSALGGSSTARVLFPGTAAKCQSGIAGAGFSIPASTAQPSSNAPPAAGCEADGLHAYLAFTASTAQIATDQFELPADWSGVLKVVTSAWSTSTSAPTITLSLYCLGVAGTTTGGTYGTAQTISLTPGASSNRTVVSTTLLTDSGHATNACAAGNLVQWQLAVTAAGGGNLNLIALRFTE